MASTSETSSPPSCRPVEDVHQAEVARTLGVSRQTISRWHARWSGEGTASLRSRGAPGRTPRLSDAQLEQAEQALLEGAKAHGFDTDLWTLDRVAAVIWRLTGVGHHPAHVWRVLRHRLLIPLHGPGSKKRQAPRCRHLLLRRVGCLADPDRAFDLGAPRPHPAAHPPLQLAACLDRRRVVLWLGWWRLPAGIPRSAWQLQHRAWSICCRVMLDTQTH